MANLAGVYRGRTRPAPLRVRWDSRVWSNVSWSARCRTSHFRKDSSLFRVIPVAADFQVW